jgi:hypothetical protein
MIVSWDRRGLLGGLYPILHGRKTEDLCLCCCQRSEGIVIGLISSTGEP